MKAYFDTSVLLKFYVEEPRSAEADALILKADAPLLFTHFHEIEIRTALRLKRGRHEITEAELKTALGNLQSDINTGRLEKPNYDVASVLYKAEEFSAKYAAETLARSLDILHVAAALVLGAREFVSFDERQRKIASRMKLKLLPASL